MSSAPDGDTLEHGEAEACALEVIEHHLGAAPRSMEHQSSGRTNFVFLVEHATGGFVVRLSPSPGKINAYMKEQWAVAAARDAGVPTPEILEVGNEVIAYPYMISRKAPGQEATTHADRGGILRQMGRYAAQINAIRTQGYGSVFDWSSNQLSRCQTWAEYLAAELRLEERLDTLGRLRLLDPPQIALLREVLESAAASQPAALNHGDLRLKNVMVDADGQITAIIDWENCVSSLAPQWEISLALHDLTIDEKEYFIDGYGLAPAALRAMAPVMTGMNLVNYVPRIRSLEERQDSAGIERLRTRFSGALDLYSL